jgi:hypothetical protein
MSSVDIQILLFNQIRSHLPVHISLPDKISNLLNISIDSAYRRIRGEKELSFDELCLLCGAFNISIDQLLNLGDGKVLFNGQFLSAGSYSFEDFLKEMLENLEHINSFDEKQLVYQNKDISIFFYLMFPDMIAFKYYLWMKTHFQFPEFKNTTFTFNQLSPENLKLINKILQVFIKIPTIEIMNPDNILTDLRQIEYFKVTKGFMSVEDINRIYDSVEKMINHIELMAQTGKKFLPGEDVSENSCVHKIFVHDFHFGDNEAVAILGDTKMTVLTHSGINFLVTNDPEFGAYSWDFMENIIRKSTLISISGEKARTRFFNLIRERIFNFRSDKVKSLVH